MPFPCFVKRLFFLPFPTKGPHGLDPPFFVAMCSGHYHVRRLPVSRRMFALEVSWQCAKLRNQPKLTCVDSPIFWGNFCSPHAKNTVFDIFCRNRYIRAVPQSFYLTHDFFYDLKRPVWKGPSHVGNHQGAVPVGLQQDLAGGSNL